MISGISSSTMASQLFSRLDTSSKGYLEKSDLASAFSKISSGSSSDSSVDDMFSALDSDSDGKVTESEFSTTLAKLQEELQSNFQQSQHMHGGPGGPGGAGGMPPPPPPEGDSGFTQDELQSQLDEIGSSDSERSSLISKIVDNFEAADTDGDGKVNFQEAMAYDQSSSSTTSTASTSTSSTSTTTAATDSTSSSSSASEKRLLQQIMQLMQAYGRPDDSYSMSSLLSTSA